MPEAQKPTFTPLMTPSPALLDQLRPTRARLHTKPAQAFGEMSRMLDLRSFQYGDLAPGLWLDPDTLQMGCRRANRADLAVLVMCDEDFHRLLTSIKAVSSFLFSGLASLSTRVTPTSIRPCVRASKGLPIRLPLPGPAISR